MITTASAVVLVGGLLQPAYAQMGTPSVCAEREVLVSSLQEDYSEQPTALGMSDNGTVVEVLATNDGATWTILMTRPDGMSCVVATGEAWGPASEQVAAAPGEEM